MGQWKKANLANKKHIWIGILIILSIIGIVIFAIKVNAENTGGTAEQREDEETLVRMTASLSRASDSNNKVNIETLTELLNRYAVNGTTTVTEKSSDTIVVTFVSTGNEYEININTGPAFDDTGITEELPSTAETTPYLPSGFSMVIGTDLDTGLTIQDGLGNQYVWVEVPKTTTVYPTAGLAITDFTNDEYTTIENDLHTYTSTYRNGTSYVDEHSGDDTSTGLTSSEYTALKQKMLKSVYQNGGFYVGKYETGIADSYRTASGDATETPVIKANAYPYNYVTCSQAQSLASSMSSGEYTSSLMFGVQWDLVLKYLETKGATTAELNEDSTSWGNYSNNLWNITSTSAKYSINYGSTYIATPCEKTSNTSCVLLTTGASKKFSKQNIYDFSGNEWECTLEYISNSGSAYALRGGYFGSDGVSHPVNVHGYGSTTSASAYIGFRVSLY